jgi:hypothetical protein
MEVFWIPRSAAYKTEWREFGNKRKSANMLHYVVM